MQSDNESTIILSAQKATINCKSDHIQYVVGVIRNGNIVLFGSVLRHSLTLDTKNKSNDGPRHVIDEPKSSATVKRKGLEARNELGIAFGSKKRKLGIKSAAENLIQVSSLKNVEAALESNVERVAQLTKQTANEDSVDRVIPKFNLDAKKPQEVYDLNDVIPPNEWDAINYKPLLKHKTLEELRENIKNSAFIIDRLHKQIKNKDRTKIKMLMYMASLMKLAISTEKNISRLYSDENAKKLSSHLCNAPDPQGLVTRFMGLRTMRDMPVLKFSARSKDKLLAYIYTLALMIDDYVLDYSLITEDLKLSAQKSHSILRELGCVIESNRVDSNLTKIAKLRVPLRFPKRTQ